MKLFFIIYMMLTSFNALAEAVEGKIASSITINSGDIPYYSKQIIQSKDFYTHAIGVLETNGVKGYYGFVAYPEFRSL